MIIVYDAFIAAICIISGASAIWYWRCCARSPAFPFLISLLINICLFTFARTLALAFGLIHTPTYAFSLWGALIVTHVVFTIVYTAKRML